ncbi:gephyrin-like molybdotransferase receptor GlpR [Streptomyces sp. NPDC091292]|uniref:divisome protein SepX/GlpR n=1 Tax=Streptomyces sp. NPDC091292 TaxID=3365991 RepID=UPI0037F84546
MSSSGLIYAVIVGAWAAYLVPMWLRRQDELNEARPTERFSTAIRLLSGRAGMERRYAKDLRARSTDQDESPADPHGDPDHGPDRTPDVITDSVDVRSFAMPPNAPRANAPRKEQAAAREPQRGVVRARVPAKAPSPTPPAPPSAQEPGPQARKSQPDASPQPQRRRPQHPGQPQPQPQSKLRPKSDAAAPSVPPAREESPARRRAAAEAAARARRSKVLARRRRTTVLLFLAFTLGAIVAAVGGLAFLWVPAVPAVLLSTYIAYLRSQERRRFTYTMDRRRAEDAAQRLRERERHPRRRPQAEAPVADEPEEAPAPTTDTGLSALAADRRALVEQTDHAEWVDQQRERQRGPGHGDSWDPVPVPLPTYVTAPVAPRATGGVDLGAPDAWSAARSSSVEPTANRDESGVAADPDADSDGDPDADGCPDERSDARRAASARRSRERGRTPLFDQYDDADRRRAANE